MTTYIIPMYHSTSGHLTLNQGLALLITLNIIFVTVALIRTIIWMYRTKGNQCRSFRNYFSYAIIDFNSFGLSCWNGLAFMIVNGIALIISIAQMINNYLETIN